MTRLAALTLALSLCAVPASAQEPVRLFAAGSLRGALSEVAAAFETAGGAKVEATFGASGLLRERIEAGAPAEVFASADMGHPRRLAAEGRALAPVVFVRNRLCGLARPGLAVESETLLGRMLDPAVKLGTSTPRNDPSGDYAWALFAKADALRPGARAALEAKALQLVGGAGPAPPPGPRSVYTELLAGGAADLFLTYCTNAIVVERELPGARRIAIPDALAVGADYGLTLLGAPRREAVALAFFVLSPAGQAILARHGFTAPGTLGE